MATLVLEEMSSEGGFGIFWTRKRRDLSNCSFNAPTASDDDVKMDLEEGREVLKLPMLDT